MLILPKLNNGAGTPSDNWKGKLKSIDDNDNLSVWIVIVDEKMVVKVTTSKKKALRIYRKANRMACAELWRKTVTLCSESEPCYQVVDASGRIVREEESQVEAMAYQYGRAAAGAVGMRVQRACKMGGVTFSEVKAVEPEPAVEHEPEQSPQSYGERYALAVITDCGKVLCTVREGLSFKESRKLRKTMKIGVMAPGCEFVPNK